MKRLLLFFLLTIISFSGFSQTETEEVFSKRDSLFFLFLGHSDTITVNTWMNIRRSNQYMKEIIFYDSILISLLSDEIMNSQINIDNQSEIARLQSTIDSLLSTSAIPKKIHDIPKADNRTIVFIALAFCFAVIVFLVLKIYSLIKKLQEKIRIEKQYYSDLNAAHAEIDRMEVIHQTMATEINSLKRELSKIEINQELLQKLEDERVLLENQIFEMRKAYLSEIEKRKELENQISLPDSGDGVEIEKLRADISEIEEGLKETESYYSVIANEFNKLMEKVKKVVSK